MEKEPEKKNTSKKDRQLRSDLYCQLMGKAIKLEIGNDLYLPRVKSRKKVAKKRVPYKGRGKKLKKLVSKLKKKTKQNQPKKTLRECPLKCK